MQKNGVNGGADQTKCDVSIERQVVDAKRARDTNYYRKMGLLKDRASILMKSELLSKSLFDRFFGEVHRSGH